MNRIGIREFFLTVIRCLKHIRNIGICDSIKSSKDGAKFAIKGLTQRLQSNDPKIVSLALTVCECCVQNCDRIFPSSITIPFLNELANVANGSFGERNSTEAAHIINQIYTSLSDYSIPRNPSFQDTFNQFKVKGWISDDSARFSFNLLNLFYPY